MLVYEVVATAVYKVAVMPTLGTFAAAVLN